MNILILNSSEKCFATQSIIKAGEKHGRKMIVLDPAYFSPLISNVEAGYDRVYDLLPKTATRITIREKDAIIPRIGNNLIYNSYVIEHLSENLGIYSIQTAYGLRAAANKFHTLQLCSRYVIKTPLTIFAKAITNIDFLIENAGVQSTRNIRPIKAELLSKLRNHEYEGVLVFKLDRWARSSTELVLEIDEFLKKGIKFISYSDNLDFSTAAGKLHFQIFGAFAEFKRALISERTREGIRRAKMTGKNLGRPKGSKDKSRRRRSGYLLRMARERQQVDQDHGDHKSIDEYLQ